MQTINGYNVEEYIENVHGSVEGSYLKKFNSDGWHLYAREDGYEFLIKDMGSDGEYIFVVVGT